MQTVTKELKIKNRIILLKNIGNNLYTFIASNICLPTRINGFLFYFIIVLSNFSEHIMHIGIIKYYECEMLFSTQQQFVFFRLI